MLIKLTGRNSEYSTYTRTLGGTGRDRKGEREPATGRPRPCNAKRLAHFTFTASFQLSHTDDVNYESGNPRLID